MQLLPAVWGNKADPVGLSAVLPSEGVQIAACMEASQLLPAPRVSAWIRKQSQGAPTLHLTRGPSSLGQERVFLSSQSQQQTSLARKDQGLLSLCFQMSTRHEVRGVAQILETLTKEIL